MTKKRFNISYPKLVAMGFLGIILIGSLLLSLPIASNSGQATPYLSCLFTATSATCVTGLVVADTFLHWSIFGRIVIITLIQIGGLGFMTLMTGLSLVLHRQISLHERTLLKDSFNTPDISGMVRLTKKILFGTLIVEGIGAVIFSIRLYSKFGFWGAVGRGVFLSISAFCNAGFDLFGDLGEYGSLVAFQNDPFIIVTAAILILIGGIGFLVWDDIVKNKWHFKRYRLHCKIALSVTLLITVVSTAAFFFLESGFTGSKEGTGQQILNAFFASVTPRTAGFNSIDINSMHPVSKILTTVLMFIGGSPGSTAGGIKTTTVAVLLICSLSNLTARSGYNVFRRRLPKDIVVHALCVLMIQLSLAICGVLLICTAQPNLPTTDVVFEVFSAIDTVGMTTGVTRELNVFSQIVITALMYCGRLGSLTFAMVFVQKKEKDMLVYPEETVSIG